MLDEQWLSIEKLRKQKLFESFEAGIDMLTNLLTNHLGKDTLNAEDNIDGGPGSGRYPKGSGKNPKTGKRTCFIKTRSNEEDSPFYLYRFKNNGFGDYDICCKEDYE